MRSIKVHINVVEQTRNNKKGFVADIGDRMLGYVQPAWDENKETAINKVKERIKEVVEMNNIRGLETIETTIEVGE